MIIATAVGDCTAEKSGFDLVTGGDFLSSIASIPAMVFIHLAIAWEAMKPSLQ
jgi:hypothetical protein